MRKVEYVVMIMVASMLLIFQVFYCASFAEGLSQYDLAELLVNKAIAENIIEDKEYTEEEIISYVEDNKLLDVSNVTEEVSFEVVRESFAKFDVFKEIAMVSDVSSAVEDDNPQDDEFQKIIPLSLETLQEINDPFSKFDSYINTTPVDENWITTTYAYDNPSTIGKYQAEIVKVLLAYALEHDLFVEVRDGGVSLHLNEDHWKSGSEGLFTFGFKNNSFDNYEDGHMYNLRIEVRSLFRMYSDDSESLADARQRLVDANFRTDDIMNAFEESLSVLFEDETVRKEIIQSIEEDYDYNRDREYSYWDFKYKIVAGYDVIRSFSNNVIEYEFEYDYKE